MPLPAQPPPRPTSGTLPPLPLPVPPRVSPTAASPTPSPAPEIRPAPPDVHGDAPPTSAPRPALSTRDRPRKRTPRPPDSPPSVTLRYIGSLRNRELPHPRFIIDKLKCISEISLAAVSYTRDHQLVLYPKAPCTVEDLYKHRNPLTSLLNSILSPADKPPPAFDTGSSWTRVVVHHAPLPPCKPPYNRFPPKVPDPPLPVSFRLGILVDDLCASNHIDRDSLHDLRALCPLEARDKLFFASEDRAPQHCSLMLCLADSDAATRLLKHGAFVQGAHCRVTLYRLRRSTHKHSTPSGS